MAIKSSLTTPPHRLGGLEERRELPSGVCGGAPTAQRFSTIFSTLMIASPDTIILIVDDNAAIGAGPRCSTVAYAVNHQVANRRDVCLMSDDALER